MIKTLSKVGVQGAYLNIIQVICEKPTANTILNGQKLKAFPVRSGTRQGHLLSPLLFYIVLEVLATVIRQEEIKGIQTGRESVKLSLFAGDMTVHGRPIGSTEKLPDLINKFGRVPGHKVNIQKSMAFLYTCNELPERETKKNSHLLLQQQKIKYLRINLTKEVKDLYSENQKNTEERN